jgi:DNA primase
MIDSAELRATVDLGQLIAADLGPGRKSGQWLQWRCPFHADDTPSLSTAIDGDHWYCFGCGAGGDAIEWLRRRQGLSFREACERLGTGQYRPTAPHPISKPADKAVGPPEADWQAKARRVIAKCQGQLWDRRGKWARRYLAGRGLSEETVKRWAIGYNWRPQRIAGLWVDAGVVIPCQLAGAAWYVKVRRAPRGPKYRQIAGGRPALFGADTLTGRSVAVFTEGEFDALLLHQLAGDLAGVVTLGSASKGLDLAQWARYLLPVSPYLLAYDLDQAGGQGAAALAGLTSRARRVQIPALRLGDKDLSDYHQAGGNLRQWLIERLAELGRPVPICKQSAELEDAWWAARGIE